MNLPGFVSEREGRWAELRDLVDRAGGRVDTLPPSDVVRLGRGYRAAAADLAIARRRFPGEAPVLALEQLVGQARSLVYANVSKRDSVRHFVSRGYWQRVRERPAFLLIAALLLFGPGLAVGTWAHGHPVEAARVAQVNSLSSGAGDGPESADRGFSGSTSTRFSTQIFTNNIKVAFTAFAGGLTGGLVTAISLVFNGLILGLVVGLALSAGNGDVLFRLLLPHGLLELSLITVAGAAGLRVGWAIIRPGTLTRMESLGTQGRAAAELALGTAIWLVPCGLVEGFVTPRGLSLGAAAAVGTGLAGLFWAMVIWRGRPDPVAATDPAPATDPVRAGLAPSG